ncbi:hypothetical protein H6F89_30195 [Cyanobacteria bacterium FACHB-63]|nr:hypothetical protein [Cyanobacteria bacterium FACHB-63]
MPELRSSAYDSTATQLTAGVAVETDKKGEAEQPVMRTALTSNGAGLFRVCWGRYRGRVICTFNYSDINHQSVVLVTASEGDEANSTASPQRFIGSADFTVTSIAPFDGGVRFAVQIIGWDEPIPFWSDIVIMDGFPPGFIRA